MNFAVRTFRNSDAETVFRIRARAFVRLFNEELTPEQISAGINAYMPSDFQRMAKEMEFFVVEESSVVVAFFALKLHDAESAELTFVFIDSEHLGRGIGSKLMHYSEDWIKEHWTQVQSFFLDTAIPKYNGGFYRRMGFIETGPSQCLYPELTVPALRFSKTLDK